MPRIRLTKRVIDALPAPASDIVYWDSGCPGFGVKVTPKGRKVFIVQYRTGGAGSKLRKYTIGPYGRVTLHQARVAAQKVFTAKLDGRDPAAEKREAKRRVVADRVEDLLETFIVQRLSQNRSGVEISRLLRREVGKPWAGSSIHALTKRDVVEVISAIEQRGAPSAANKTLKSLKTFLRWCVGRAVLEQSPAEGIPLPAKRRPCGSDRAAGLDDWAKDRFSTSSRRRDLNKSRMNIARECRTAIARTYRYTRTRRGVERSNDTKTLPLRPFCRGCIIATRGYDFRKEHLYYCHMRLLVEAGSLLFHNGVPWSAGSPPFSPRTS